MQALLGLNELLGSPEKPAIEVVLVSRNHPDCAIRVIRSLAQHKIRLRRAVLMGGRPVMAQLQALQWTCSSPKEESDVQAAIRGRIPAGLIYGGSTEAQDADGVLVFAFDGDAVLFSDQADRIYREQHLAGFKKWELKNATMPPASGPSRRFAEALEELRSGHPIEAPPFRIVLVTARDFMYGERALQTLRSWGTRIDAAAFVMARLVGRSVAATGGGAQCHSCGDIPPFAHIRQRREQPQR